MANPFVRVGGFFGRFFGNTIGESAAYGIGGAMQEPIRPLLQELANATWKASVEAGISKPLAPATAAAVEAQAYSGTFDAETEAAKGGWGAQQFAVLKFLAESAPGTPELLELWRRDKLSPALVKDGLKKAGLMDEYVDAIMELFTGRLDPAVVAAAIQRGIMDDPGFLPVGPPSGSGKVPKFPVSPLDPIAEAKAHGIDRERLFVETALVGNPMSPDQAASALFRKIIERVDYDRAIAEGRTRNEWADAILEQARTIPTPHQFVEGRLRGWLTDDEMNKGTARWGMTPEDTHLDFLITGRPLSWHQVFIGIRRGGVYDGPTDDIEPSFLKALKESNIRPEWYHIAWHLRFAYPTGFMVRGAVTSGDLTPQQGNDILYELGWNQKWIDIFVKAWSGSDTTGGKELVKAELIDEFEGGFLSPSELRDHLTALGYTGAALDLEIHLADARRIKAWRDKAITALGKRYVGSTMEAAAADTYLQDLQVVDPTTRARIIGIWDIEREFK